MNPNTIVGRFVRLDLLQENDAAEIAAAAASGGRETYAYGPVPSADPTVNGAEDAQAYVAAESGATSISMKGFGATRSP